ncbi:hypothetical protein [Peribacillus simplex]|uniref:hypothetical protein n=1 Tax=Peribacillus simplex TaxID=1478 RepID=UPI003D2C5F67
MERKVETPAGKARQRETPQAESRGGSLTARGKRVPGVEINVQILPVIKKCRQKRLYLIVKAKLIGAGVRDSCLEKSFKGRHQRRKPKADRQRKASALRSNQRPNCTF